MVLYGLYQKLPGNIKIEKDFCNLTQEKPTKKAYTAAKGKLVG
jgi:hypothetical protein